MSHGTIMRHEQSEGSKQVLPVQIRWLLKRDMLNALRIEHASFELPWTEEDFLCCLRQRNCIGMCAEYDHHIVGFMVYELHKARIRILNFAVEPESRRLNVGTQMVNRLIDKLSQQRRKEITLLVRETNLEAQLFFRAQGFLATQLWQRYFEDTDEDAYLMRYRLRTSDDDFAPHYAPKNRIAEYDAA